MISILKRGYWAPDRDLLPPDEFEERVRVIQAVLAARRLACVVLCGDADSYAVPCYVTGMPDGSTVIVPVDSEPVIVLSSWSWRELPFLRTLTWVRDIRVAEAGEPLDAMLRSVIRDFAGDTGVVATAGFPVSMEPTPAAVMTTALAPFTTVTLDDELAHVRSALRPRELEMTRRVLAIASAAAQEAIDAHTEGATNAEAFLTAERKARMLGVRDVRVLANIRSDALQPFEATGAERLEHLTVYVAVERQGYWGDVLRGTAEVARSRAVRAVEAMASAVSSAVTCGDIAAAGIAALDADTREAALSYGLGGLIGLDLDEPLQIVPDRSDPLAPGNVLSLRVVTGRAGEAASAAVVVDRDGGKRLS